MAVILPHDLYPLAGKMRDRLFLKRICGRHLAPHKQSLAVTPVKKSLVLDFLMFPHTVIPCRQYQIDILHQCLLRRRRQMGFLPIPLVKDQTLIKRHIIQQYLSIFYMDLAHAKIAFRLICPLPVRKCELHIVEPGILRRPRHHLPRRVRIRHADVKHDVFAARTDLARHGLLPVHGDPAVQAAGICRFLI